MMIQCGTVSREQTYVSISRGRADARVYTDDAEALRRAVTRDPKKEIALDAVKQRPTQQQQFQAQSLSITISKPRERKHWHNLYGYQSISCAHPYW
jgi:hypothetical protein